MKPVRRLLVAFGLMILSTHTAPAAVKLPAIIGDNMCLQEGMPVPIWGWADPGEKVTVSVAGQSQSATAGADGKWMVKLTPLQPGEPQTVTVAGSNTITLNNVLVGEVWVCSGQSNMEFNLGGANNASTEIPKATFPKIRLFTVTRTTALDPQADCVGKWVECSPETVRGFSAVGYFFGKDIYQSHNVPVGLIHSSWGGTPAQAWTSHEGLSSSPELKDYVDSVDKTKANLPALTEDYEKKTLPKWEANDAEWKKKSAEQLAEWKEKADAAKAAGQPIPAKPNPGREPQKPAEPGHGPGTPTVLYNGMIAPLVPYAIQGAIWYQGEANVGRGQEYATLFPTMITSWRNAWGEGDFPFLFVQLANYLARKDEPTDSGWARLREAQTKTLSLPKTGMAVIIDIGQGDNIHPKDKVDVGHRLALAAEHVAYGKDLVYSGPIYDHMEVAGNSIKVYFKNIGGGLTIAATPTTQPGVEPAAPAANLQGFAIAGEDKNFVWADAKIDGDTVIVSSPSVEKPVAVRYGWADNPAVNLYNKEGLPASPFRTDDWPQAAPVTKPAR